MIFFVLLIFIIIILQFYVIFQLNKKIDDNLKSMIELGGHIRDIYKILRGRNK